jgi:hypothetical protein
MALNDRSACVMCSILIVIWFHRKTVLFCCLLVACLEMYIRAYSYHSVFNLAVLVSCWFAFICNACICAFYASALVNFICKAKVKVFFIVEMCELKVIMLYSDIGY